MKKDLFIIILFLLATAGLVKAEEYYSKIKVRCIQYQKGSEKYCEEYRPVKKRYGRCVPAGGILRAKCTYKYKTVGRKCVRYGTRSVNQLSQQPLPGFFDKKEYADKVCYAYVEYQ